MTSLDFAGFDALVIELWPQWKGWTDANKQLVLKILKPYPANACADELRKQRYHKPDAPKPLWEALRGDLASKFKHDDRRPEEVRLDEKGMRDSVALRNWIKGHSPEEIHALVKQAVDAVPTLRNALEMACRFMPRSTLDGFVARAWSQGDRFEDLAYTGDQGARTPLEPPKPDGS